MSGPPLIPLSRTVRLALAGAASSRSMLAAALAWLALLAAVYAADAGPPLAAMAVTASGLLPVGAWAGAAHLATTSEDLRALLTAADGRARVLAGDLVPPASFVLAAGLAGVVAAVAFDPHPAPARAYAAGLGLHMLCGAVGVASASTLAALRWTRGAQALVVVAGSVASGRLAWLPPDGPVLAVWTADRPASAALLAWAVAGPILATALLLCGTGLLRRRRC